MRILTFLFGFGLLVALSWIFWVITYPLAKRLGIFKEGGKND